MGVIVDRPVRLGQLFRERRRALGRTIDEVAVRAHISPSRLGQMERGGAIFLPAPDVLRGLQEALGLGREEILTAAGYGVPVAQCEGDQPQ